MKNRVVEIDCAGEQAQALSKIIRAYVSAAYPEGGSECTQVARETLLDTASTCATHPEGTLKLRKRQMPMLRAAVHWWLSEHADAEDSIRNLEALLETKRKRAG